MKVDDIPSVYTSKAQTIAFIRQVVEQPTCNDGSSFLLFCLTRNISKSMFIFTTQTVMILHKVSGFETLFQALQQ